MVTVATGFSPTGRVEYGDRFLATFEPHWPSNTRLFCYVEESFATPRALLLHLACCDGLNEFIEANKGNPEYCGKKENSKWFPRDKGKPYNFRFDAIKFCRQLSYIDHCARTMCADGELLIWLDGDVVTLRDVPATLMDQLIGNHDVAYIGRERVHSEIGFYAVRLSSITRDFLASMPRAYFNGAVFELAEWHSAFVFDHFRRAFETAGMRSRNLTNHLHPMASRHPWVTTQLVRYMDHTKGRRKSLGRSPEHRQ